MFNLFPVATGRFSTLPFMYGLGIVCALAVTVLLFIFILPEKKREKLPKIFQIVHDIFNFKNLMLETILRALYVFTTFAFVLVGFFMLFGFASTYFDTLKWYGGYGILVMIVGPIVTRIVYEILMMFILLVKNTMEINKKMKTHEEDKTDDQQ